MGDVIAMKAEAAAIARRRPDAIQASMDRHPSGRGGTFNSTRRALLLAARLIGEHTLPDSHVHIHGDGMCVTLDYTGRLHATGDVRVAAQALGISLAEYATETPDGCAAVELRGQTLIDSVLITVRATIAIPTTWPSP